MVLAMQIKTIIDYLEEIAPLSYQESYDNAGLLTGDPRWELSNALLTLDATEPVIDEAIARGCNLVIAHHPIIWGGLKKINGKNYVERAVIKAIKHDIAIYAAHTNLDNIRGGVNDMLCRQLGLGDLRPLAPRSRALKKLYTFVPHAQAEKVREALFASGAGHIGQYDACSYNTEGYGTFRGAADTHPYAGEAGKKHREPETRIEVVFPAPLESTVTAALCAAHPYEEPAYDILLLENSWAGVGSGMVGMLPAPVDEGAFLQQVKTQLSAGGIRHTALLGKPVRKVAVCGGAGSFLLPAARRAGADVYLSADFKYHEFFDADSQILIIDVGHYESEQFTPLLFYELLTKKFPNFAPLKTAVLTNPIHYLH
ncbi:Nif3-like dinuclear metal center hexameric protein [Compostibacter hankyongensis]|uniref:GTP cyclohydrolase 1 type 2 homolog n=1 Tax=Compostibacter hankyongensis TaxID=1007089 RepID=A0ABP8FY60_9BACT